MVERTARWQAGESLATFVWRHTNASLPPGVTPEQCDMKSERQDDLSALCWALDSCACAVAVNAVNAKAVRPASRLIFKMFDSFMTSPGCSVPHPCRLPLGDTGVCNVDIAFCHIVFRKSCVHKVLGTNGPGGTAGASGGPSWRWMPVKSSD